MAKWTKADGVKLGHLLEDWKTFDRKPGKERIHLRGDVVESILKSKGQQALLTKLRDVCWITAWAGLGVLCCS